MSPRATDPVHHIATIPTRIVMAAGGIVIVPGTDTGALRVLVVHRPAYDDWSLPKGHLDPGESPEAAAVREVEEETGIVAHIVVPVGTTQHEIPITAGNATKRVHWFLMHPSDLAHPIDPSARPADDEIDTAAWWPVAIALAELTHTSERDVLLRAITVASSGDAVI